MLALDAQMFSTTSTVGERPDSVAPDTTHPPDTSVGVHKHFGEFTGASLTSTTTTAQAGI